MEDDEENDWKQYQILTQFSREQKMMIWKFRDAGEERDVMKMRDDTVALITDNSFNWTEYRKLEKMTNKEKLMAWNSDTVTINFVLFCFVFSK